MKVKRLMTPRSVTPPSFYSSTPSVCQQLRQHKAKRKVTRLLILRVTAVPEFTTVWLTRKFSLLVLVLLLVLDFEAIDYERNDEDEDDFAACLRNWRSLLHTRFRFRFSRSCLFTVSCSFASLH
jgi:hypothetical protein